MVHHREMAGVFVFAKVERTVDRVVNRLLPGAIQKTILAPQADLASEGGIRTNSEEIERIRKAAVDQAGREILDKRLALWSENVFLEMFRMIRREGGQICFFVMPLHPVQLKVFQTASQSENRRRFLEKMADLGIPVLSPEFSTVPEDFPDIWHLAKSRSKAFTLALARAWIARK